ncbi:MAG TPA: hypothetical protein VF756_18455 [Thermoanaerobaculia bacterium]
MKRKVILTLMVVAVLAASAPVWAAPPFGSFGGKVGGGNSGQGLLPLHGWALDDGGVEAVDILVDGVVAGRADLGRSRPRVREQFPGFPDASAAGWAFELDTTRFLNGLHRVTPRVKSRTGEVVNLNSRVFEFNNVTHNLVPFGKIEFPNRQAEMRGNCDLADPARRFTVVSGYAMDNGVQADDTGVGWVELLIDRAVRFNTQRDCFHSAATGGSSNCYGLRRMDLVPMFPGVADAPHSGFRFVLDIGVLIEAFGYGPESHLLTIRAGDHFGQVTNIAEMPVTFTCDEDIFNEETLGEISNPRNGQLFSGIIQAIGWALDWEGVAQIQVLVDGSPVGNATHGFARPAVTSAYPGYPESAAPGWQISFDSREFSNGEHWLEVIVTDDLGVTTYIGRRRIVIANPHP